MTPVETLLAVHRAGASVSLTVDGKLYVRSSGPLPDELKAALRAHGDRLIQLLSISMSEQPPRCDAHPRASESKTPSIDIQLDSMPRCELIELVTSEMVRRNQQRQIDPPIYRLGDILVHKGVDVDERVYPKGAVVIVGRAEMRYLLASVFDFYELRRNGFRDHKPPPPFLIDHLLLAYPPQFAPVLGSDEVGMRGSQ